MPHSHVCSRLWRAASQSLALIALTSLIACGGGGGGSKPPAPSSTPPASVAVALSSVPASVAAASSKPASSSTASSVAATADNLLAADIWSNVNFWGGDGGSGSAVGSYTKVAVENMGFKTAARIVVTKPTGELWNGQLQFPVVGSFANGDVILVKVWFRSIESADESGAGFTTLFMESGEPDYTKFVTRDLNSTGDWQEYFIPLKVAGYKTGDQVAIKFGFGAGAKPQTFEVGGLEALNYHQQVALSDLPKTLESYPGREADAPWRAQAAARIEQYRKGDFTLHLKDATNNPIADAKVEVKFKRHAYQFGSVIVSNILMGTSADSIKYADKVLELFNQSGTENDLKWAPWIGEWGGVYNQPNTLSALQWLKDRDFYLRGHVMVWPSKRNLPNLVQPYFSADNPAVIDPAIKQVVLDHIDDVGSATAGVLDEWDVLNEPYDNHDLMDAFGDSIMVDWFQRARNNLPSQKLYINDYSILSGGGRNFAHQDHYKKTIKFLVDNNAPVDGIGMQSHFGTSPTDLDTVYKILNDFTALYPNLVIRSTEFDINTSDEALQADYTRDFLTMFFSHPNTVGVQLWGFWAGAHWTPDASMYTKDWREKPNAVAWKKLIKETWWNNFEGVSDSSGSYSNRGFYGRYEVTVTQGNKTHSYTIDLKKAGVAEFDIVVPTE